MGTHAAEVDISLLMGWVVIYCYPMTGVPSVALPPGWDHIPGAHGCTPQSNAYKQAHPAFKALGQTLLKRLTIIAHEGMIQSVRYPIFPSDSDAAWVLNYLKAAP